MKSKEIKITIFTPTYNRGNEKCLGQCYKDLCAQTCKDFVWLIIDDGSTDGTREFVRPWLDKNIMEQNGFEIKYVYKKNGGTHTGYNKAFDLCETELIFCFETDDELLPKAIEMIYKAAEGRMYDESIGLISTTHYIGRNEIIGTPVIGKEKLISFQECYYKYHIKGDKFFVYKMKSIGDYRFPEYDGEKLCGTSAMLLTIHGKYLIVNENIYNKSYLEDGYSHGDVALNLAKSPKGFSYLNKVKLAEIRNIRSTVKSAIHYIGCSLLSGNTEIIKNSPRKCWTILLYPFGIVWYLLLRKKRRLLYNTNIGDSRKGG